MNIKMVVVAVAVSLLSTATLAQRAPALSPPPQEKQLSGDEMKSKAGPFVSAMHETYGGLLKLLEDVRHEKPVDVNKLNCVNEKLTATKALLRIAEQARANLEEAVTKNQPDIARHEYEKVTIAHQKITLLKAEAEACTGRLTYTGDTKIEIEEPKDQAAKQKEDTTLKTWSDWVEQQRPPKVSPYL